MTTQVLMARVKCVYYFVMGHWVAWIHGYDKTYLTGRWFAGRMGGIAAPGWRWIVVGRRGCRRLGVNGDVKWAVAPRQVVLFPHNIHFHPDDLNNFQSSGCYFQGLGQITIGRGTYIAPNVGIITSNHVPEDLDAHEPPKAVTIGEGCWIGMNAVILPGVELGPRTVVGAGAVVTKSFPDGRCVLGGVPARVLRTL